MEYTNNEGLRQQKKRWVLQDSSTHVLTFLSLSVVLFGNKNSWEQWLLMFSIGYWLLFKLLLPNLNSSSHRLDLRPLGPWNRTCGTGHLASQKPELLLEALPGSGSLDVSPYAMQLVIHSHVYMYVCMYVHKYLCLWLSRIIYVEKERGRERERVLFILDVYVIIYIYIYIVCVCRISETIKKWLPWQP